MAKYAESNTCGGEGYAAQITNSTGPTVTVQVAEGTQAITPGTFGFATAWFAVWASRDGSLGVRHPTYGDVNYQPTSFMVDIRHDAPPPSTGATSEFFSWTGVNPNTAQGHFNPWSWGSNQIIQEHPITLKRMLPGGAVNTSYNGTATLTHVRQGSGQGQLNVSRPTTVTFVNGVVTFGVTASYFFISQSFAYFNLIATDGPISTASPGCTALHY
jgi:hypothetical protein